MQHSADQRTRFHHVLVQVLAWSLALGITAMGVFDLYLLFAFGTRLDAWFLETLNRRLAFWAIFFLSLTSMAILWRYFIPDWWRHEEIPKLIRLGLFAVFFFQPYGMLLYYYRLYAPRKHRLGPTS